MPSSKKHARKRSNLTTSRRETLGTYRHCCQKHFEMVLLVESMTETVNDLDPIFWRDDDGSKRDHHYKQAVIWHAVIDFNAKTLTTFKRLFREEFSLKHDIKWIGVVVTKPTPGEPGTGGRLDAAFLVHEEDIPKISVRHRLELGFRWFIDAVGQGQPTDKIYPRTFKQAYNIQP